MLKTENGMDCMEWVNGDVYCIGIDSQCCNENEELVLSHVLVLT